MESDRVQGALIFNVMIIHRYLFAHYQQVAVYFWPILFWNLWRVDRWSAATGRQAFVQVDRYGRAWVPYFEGMARNHMAHDPDTRFYAPSDVEGLCPQVFERAVSLLSDGPGLDPGSPSWLPDLRPEIPGRARDNRTRVRLEPG
ncbi:MAG: hypothetical protein AAF642_11560 [Pseudomonadota bacterium]